MNCAYHDIRSRCAEAPRWFDEHAVPRYVEFAPSHAASIYAKEAVLVRIECQACRHEFDVCFTHAGLSLMRGARPPISAAILDGTLDYGDPPNVECCPAGPTMTSVPKRVLQYWRRTTSFDWERVARLEVDISAEWADDCDQALRGEDAGEE
jgi:hypothetical protein